MKKTIKGYVAGFITCAMIMTLVFASASVMRELHFGVNVELDGQMMSFDEDSTPFITEGRTFLPVRAIADAAGLTVDFNAATNTVILRSANVATVTPPPTPTPEPTPPPAPSPAPTGTLIHEDEFVRITWVGVETTAFDEQMVFLAENRTDVQLTFQSGSLSINGISIGFVIGSDSVAPQSTGRIRFINGANDGPFPTHYPDRISGNIRAVDFSRTLFPRAHEMNFINVTIQ